MAKKKAADDNSRNGELWTAIILGGVLVAAGLLTWHVFANSASALMGQPAFGAIMLIGWVFVLLLSYQGFSSLLLLMTRRWMHEAGSSSNYIDSKALARTKLVLDIAFSVAAVTAVAVVALQLLGLPKP